MSLTTTVRRTGLAGMATSLVLGACVYAGGAASAAPATFSFDRISGSNRYATSAKVADQFGTANTVILASGEPGSYPDALTANYLAGLKKAPVLLTHRDSVPTEVKQAISDTGAKNVIIVGGEAAVSKDVQNSLDGTYKVRRIAGADRFATAAAVIDDGDQAPSSTALLATGFNFPDALGGGALSYADGLPLAITKPSDAPDDVVASLKKAGIDHVVILGGTSAVDDQVVTELQNNGISSERIKGADRAETSTNLAKYEIKNYKFSETGVDVASGYPKGDGADALGGAPLAGQASQPLLITKSNTQPGDSVLTFLGGESKTLTKGTIFGGTSAVSQSAEDQMIKAVMGSGAQNTTSGKFYGTVEQAIADAKAGESIDVFGDVAGFAVDKKGVTITGDDGSNVTSAITVSGADNVTLKNLTIVPSKVANQGAGIYLDGVDGLTIDNVTVTGTGTGDQSAGVINVSGGADETATIENSTFSKLAQGVFANATADFTIDGNKFTEDTAGSANDAVSTITNNTFLNNKEGVGMSVKGSSVKDNSFANNSQDHVGDYTSDQGIDLQGIIGSNTFDEPVRVTDDGKYIVDQS